MANTLVQISPFFGHGIDKNTGKVIRIESFTGQFHIHTQDELIGKLTIHQTPLGQKAITFNDTLKIYINEGKEHVHGIGAGIWMSSLVLSCWIKTKPELFKNKCILELGSGVGLCGVVLASMQSPVRSIKLTDSTQGVCQLINDNIEINSMCCSVIPTVQKFDWQDALEQKYSAKDQLQRVYDIVIAADCLYHNTKDILKEAVLKNLANGGVFIMANPPETSRAGIDEFIYALKEHGDVHIEPHFIKMMHGGYSEEIYIVVMQKYHN